MFILELEARLVHQVLRDEERDGVCALRLDLLLAAEAAIKERLYTRPNVLDKLVMRQQYVVFEGPEGGELVWDGRARGECYQDGHVFLIVVLYVLVQADDGGLLDPLSLSRILVHVLLLIVVATAQFSEASDD